MCVCAESLRKEIGSLPVPDTCFSVIKTMF